MTPLKAITWALVLVGTVLSEDTPGLGEPLCGTETLRKTGTSCYKDATDTSPLASLCNADLSTNLKIPVDRNGYKDKCKFCQRMYILWLYTYDLYIAVELVVYHSSSVGCKAPALDEKTMTLVSKKEVKPDMEHVEFPKSDSEKIVNCGYGSLIFALKGADQVFNTWSVGVEVPCKVEGDPKLMVVMPNATTPPPPPVTTTTPMPPVNGTNATMPNGTNATMPNVTSTTTPVKPALPRVNPSDKNPFKSAFGFDQIEVNLGSSCKNAKAMVCMRCGGRGSVDMVRHFCLPGDWAIIATNIVSG